MKKFVFISFFLFFSVACVHAAPVIPEEFYLRNESLYERGTVAVMSILPNTLRLTLFEGESSEIYADILPEAAEDTELVWSLPDNAGKVNIYPRGGRCTVFAVSEGEENIRITRDMLDEFNKMSKGVYLVRAGRMNYACFDNKKMRLNIKKC